MDPRLYDIVANLATDNNIDAVSTFKDILEERAAEAVKAMTREFKYSGSNND